MYGFFYGIGDLSEKEVSDNRKLDYMRAILESKSSTKSFLSPGNFDTLKANNNDINKAKKDKRGFKEVDGKLVEDINAMNPSSWVQIADQMNTGKALIGVAANANAAHAIFQHAKELLLKEGFNFNSKTYNDLTALYSESGKLITKNIAELLAAFVDNGKDPQAKYSNINNYTIDVAVSMALLGIDLDTIQYFLTQDIIEDFVTEYKNLGGTKDAENKVKAKYGVTNDVISKHTPENINNEDIKNYKLDSYTAIKAFMKYKEIARPISNLVTAIKQGENGLGPTDSHNLDRIDKFTQADNFDSLSGAMDLLRNTELFPERLNRVIVEGREIIVEKAGLPNRDEGAFNRLRSMFRNYKGTNNLTVDQIEFINKNYLDFLASSFDAFKFDKQLIADLPKRLESYKKNNPEKYNLILSRLNLDVDKANNITYITYTGLSGQDKHLVDRIRDDWESMLIEGNEAERKLAEDLIKYTFMLSGFRISPQSFSHLAPVVYFSEVIPEFNSYMKDKIKSAENFELEESDRYVDNFYHQFIRNHFRTLGYIPKVDLQDHSDYNMTKEGDMISLTTNNPDHRGKDSTFVDYIKVKHNKFPNLYNTILVKDSVEIGKTGYEISATYVPVEALGTYKSGRGLVRGKMFTHYNFNGPAENIFKQNKIKQIESKDKIPTMKADSETLTSDNPVKDKCNKNGM